MMSAKLSDEIILKIRKEIRNGKSRRQIAKETGLSVDTICKYGKNITPGKINDNFKSIIRREVLFGKTKKQVAKEYGIDYSTVKRITCDIKNRITKLSDWQKKQIRDMVKQGKYKKDVSKETGIPYHLVRKYTKDITFCNMISYILQKHIQDEWEKGKTKKQIAEECNISYNTVQNYARKSIPPYRRYTDVPDEVIKNLREQVKQGKSKLKVSEEMNISYAKVKRFTKDLQGGTIKRKPRLSKYTINKIRNEVKSGKPKMQVSRELNISPKLVYYHTPDIIIGHKHDLGIAGNTLKLLQEIMENGYAKPSKEYQYKCYQKLRLRFPNIRRVEMYGKIIYFIQENSDLAMRVFLEELNKKIISYQELQQIINVFDGEMTKKDREKYVLINK